MREKEALGKGSLEREMKREGESGEGGAEKEENLGEKLRRRRGKSRSGPSTPVVSSWRLCPFGHNTIIKDPHLTSNTTTSSVSARKLAAALWEFQNYHYLPLSKMHRAPHNNGGPAAPPPRLRHLQLHHHLSKDKGLDLSNFLADNSPSSPDQVLVLNFVSLPFQSFWYVFN